jgi:hypothetical protein
MAVDVVGAVQVADSIVAPAPAEEVVAFSTLDLVVAEVAEDPVLSLAPVI